MNSLARAAIFVGTKIMSPALIDPISVLLGKKKMPHGCMILWFLYNTAYITKIMSPALINPISGQDLS